MMPGHASGGPAGENGESRWRTGGGRSLSRLVVLLGVTHTDTGPRPSRWPGRLPAADPARRSSARTPPRHCW
jgi:hypothetical protein